MPEVTKTSSQPAIENTPPEEIVLAQQPSLAGNEQDTKEVMEDYITYRKQQDKEAFSSQLFSDLDNILGEEQKAEAPPPLPELDFDEEGEGLGFFKDVGLGLGQGMRSISRGITKGFNEILDIGGDIDKLLGMPLLQITDEEGNFSLDLISQETAAERGLKPIRLPVPNEPGVETVTGDVIETFSQFLSGFGVAGKALQGVKTATKTGKVAKLATQGGLGDVLAFDEQEERLSNIIQQVPALQNPVTEYLEADPDDEFAEAKFKQAVEGVGLGFLTDGLVGGVRILNRARKARAALRAEEEAEILGQVPELETESFSFLGNAEEEDFILRKINKTISETGEVTEETVASSGKRGPKAIDEIQINYARINGPDDIKNTMQALANEPSLKPSVDKARRGVRSNRITLKAAQDIDGFDTLVSRREGDAFNAEQITAARMLYYDATEKLMVAARRASSVTATDIDQFNFRKMVATHHAIQKEVLGARAEAGRALQAWSIPLKGTGGERTKQLEQLLLEFGGPDASRELARKLAAAGDLTASQINKITRLSATTRTLRGLEEAWTLGLLTNPVTHAVNLTSNILTTSVAGVERSIASVIPGSGVKGMEPIYFWSGMLDAQKEAMKNAATAFRSGQVGFGTGKVELPRIRATALDQLDPSGPMKPLAMGMDLWGRVVQNAGKALAAGDEYSKTIAYKGQIKALSYRQAADEGLTGTELKRRAAIIADDPPVQMQEEARDFANYVTFTRELGATGQSFQKLASKIPGARFIVPFYKTPANIFKYTFERTPLAVLSKNVRNELAAGGTRAAAAQAKIGLGTAIMAMGVDSSLQGSITGGGPTDPGARQALMRRGWRPYSIKVGEDYYSYARLEPLATVLGMSADMAEILSNYESYDVARQEEIEEAVSASVMVVANQVINKTFLSGLANTFEMLSDPGRYGENYVNRFAGSLIPAGVAAIERATDPQKEHVFNALDAIKARIPGNGVADRFNVWGEPLQNFYPGEDGLISATGEKIGAMINPFYYSSEVESPIDDWMLANGARVTMPQKNQVFTFGREKFDVDMRDFPQAYSRLVELRGTLEHPRYGGRTMKEFLNAFVLGEVPQSVYLRTRSAEKNALYIRAVVSDYGDLAKDVLADEMPEIIGKPRVETEINERNDKPFP